MPFLVETLSDLKSEERDEKLEWPDVDERKVSKSVVC